MNTNAENNPSSQGFSKPSKDTADASASASHAWRISSFEDIRDLPASSVVPEEPSKARRSSARSKKKPAREYTVGEEIANSISHGIGAALAVAAIPICVVIAVSHGGGVALAAALIYTISMLLEYLASTLYHALVPLPAKKVFKVLDHSAIYLFIAGSYTPFCLITLANSNGLFLCIGVWALAIVGIAFEAFWVYRPRWISAVIYLLIEWCV